MLKTENLSESEINDVRKNLENTIKVIAFDLYWTCIDSNRKKIWNWKRLWKLKQVLMTNIIDFDKKEEIKEKYKEIPWFKQPSLTIDSFIRNMKNHLYSSKLFYDFDVIEQLKDSWYQIAAVSNLAKPFWDYLDNMVFRPKDIFDYKIYSYNEWYTKPDPRIFEVLKSKVNEDKPNNKKIDFQNILMVWDNFNSDIKWAKNVWMIPIYINRWKDKNNEIQRTEKENIIIIHSLYDLILLLGCEN